MFTRREEAYNIYQELSGWNYTCTVCDSTWYSTFANMGQQHHCIHEVMVREWDDSMSYVHITINEDDTVHMQYQDGTIHTVTLEYMNSILIQRMH